MTLIYCIHVNSVCDSCYIRCQQHMQHTGRQTQSSKVFKSSLKVNSLSIQQWYLISIGYRLTHSARSVSESELKKPDQRPAPHQLVWTPVNMLTFLCSSIPGSDRPHPSLTVACIYTHLLTFMTVPCRL